MSKEPKPPVHGAENFSVSAEAQAIPEVERVIITREDLRPPKEFKKGEALISLIVNVKDIRDPKDGEIGALYPEQAAEFSIKIESFMDQLYDGLPTGERGNVDVLVFAGETDLVTPGTEGLRSPHQRAVETGDLAIAGIKKSMRKHGIDETESLTTKNGKPIATDILNDLKLLHTTGMGADKKYLEHLIDKYGTGRKLWMIFEDDTEKETRERLGAEGPSEIAKRMNDFISTCSTIIECHQKNNPEKRVVVFVFGHYDNLSPWIKEHLLGIDPAKGFVPIEKGGGLVIKKSADNTAATNIGNKTFPVKMESII